MDWSIPCPNLLAAVTYKTKALEIWDTETGNFIRRIMFENRVVKVSWSPTEKEYLFALTTER